MRSVVASFSKRYNLRVLITARPGTVLPMPSSPARPPHLHTMINIVFNAACRMPFRRSRNWLWPVAHEEQSNKCICCVAANDKGNGPASVNLPLVRTLCLTEHSTIVLTQA